MGKRDDSAMAVVAIIFLALILGYCMSSCKDDIVLKPGDCIDESRWVTIDGELVGNQYMKVIKLNIVGGYIVKECTIVDSKHFCEMRNPPLNNWIVQHNFSKIKCPE